MKHTRRILALAALAVLAGLLYYLYGGGAVPAGQRPLLSLNAVNFDRLRSDFNSSRGMVRVIALLSPT